jgi:ABC-2 type transport system permease protein
MSGEGQFSRMLAVSAVSFQGAFRGLRTIGLVFFALVPTFILLALTTAHPSTLGMENAAEGLLAVLTLPIVVMIVVLVLAVAQFRNEIDSETLVYLTDRSVRRSTLVAGKFFGAWAASLVLVVPAALLPLTVAAAYGATPSTAAVPWVVAVATALSTGVYVGFFLFLGLVSRSALVVGLIFGFIWEELLLLLPGSVPLLTVSYYARAFLSGEITSGPLSTFPTGVSVATAAAVLVGVAVFFLAASMWALGSIETAPERVSA